MAIVPTISPILFVMVETLLKSTVNRLSTIACSPVSPDVLPVSNPSENVSLKDVNDSFIAVTAPETDPVFAINNPNVPTIPIIAADAIPIGLANAANTIPNPPIALINAGAAKAAVNKPSAIIILSVVIPHSANLSNHTCIVPCILAIASLILLPV